MALQGRCAVPLHLRKRFGALLFSAARISGCSARELQPGRHPQGIFDAKTLCRFVHNCVRSSSGYVRFLAGSANPRNSRRRGARSDSSCRRSLSDPLDPTSSITWVCNHERSLKPIPAIPSARYEYSCLLRERTLREPVCRGSGWRTQVRQ